MTAMCDPKDIREYVFAGNAVFTIVSTATGNRFTYKVRKQANDTYLISLLTGDDNMSAYTRIARYYTKSKIDGKPFVYLFSENREAPSRKAIMYFFYHLDNPLYYGIKFYHEGRCGCCGRRLTTPESIERGIGPECWHKYCS